MSVRLPAHHVAVIACWSAPHRPAALLLCLLFITVMNSSQPLSFFFVDLINQSLISCGDLFFLITTVSFRAGGPSADFFSFFRSSLLKRRHPLARLSTARRRPVRVQSVAMASVPRAEPRAKPAVLSLIGSERSGGRNVSGSSAVRQFKGQLSACRRRHMA